MVETVKAMCESDMVFLYGAFGWVFDPTHSVSTVQPLVMMPFQRDLAAAVEESIVEQHDLRIPKSREMAASWTVCLVYWHFWRYRQGQNFLLGSRNETYVDQPGNPKALFQKIDFMHERLPGFLKCPYLRTAMRLQNMMNGSLINGESTTKDFARGDRRTSLFMDELAAGESRQMRAALVSTAVVSRSRIFASTLNPEPNAFDDVMAMPLCREMRVHWSMWPSKARGMYVGDKATRKVALLDDHRHPEGYPFVCDGKRRSPYYDWMEARLGGPHAAAVELDIDKSAGNYTFFEPGLVQALVAECARPPMFRGELKFAVKEDGGSVRVEIDGFEEKRDGRLMLWAKPDLTGGLPLDRRYGIGADVAAGTGASNTCISCGDARTGEKVAALVSPTILPHEAGLYAVALAKWLANAHLIWEAPGPGREFGAMVVRAGYANVYCRKNEKAMFPQARPRNPVPGWYPNSPDDVLALYSDYRMALSERRFLNRDADALKECEQIIRHESGRIVHAGSFGRTDPSGAKANHGDRPTADALCWRAMGGHGGIGRAAEAPSRPPPGSMMWRRMKSAEESKERGRWTT